MKLPLLQTLLKIVKSTSVEGERLLCGVCPLKVSATPPFILVCGWFGRSKIGNYSKPTLGVINAPPDEDGPERQWWGCWRTPGAAALVVPSLATVFMLWAAGWAWIIPMLELGPNL